MSRWTGKDTIGKKIAIWIFKIGKTVQEEYCRCLLKILHIWVKEFVLWKTKKSTVSLHQPENKHTDTLHKQGKVRMSLYVQ